MANLTFRPETAEIRYTDLRRIADPLTPIKTGALRNSIMMYRMARDTIGIFWVVPYAFLVEQRKSFMSDVINALKAHYPHIYFIKAPSVMGGSGDRAAMEAFKVSAYTALMFETVNELATNIYYVNDIMHYYQSSLKNIQAGYDARKRELTEQHSEIALDVYSFNSNWHLANDKLQEIGNNLPSAIARKQFKSNTPEYKALTNRLKQEKVDSAEYQKQLRIIDLYERGMRPQVIEATPIDERLELRQMEIAEYDLNLIFKLGTNNRGSFEDLMYRESDTGVERKQYDQALNTFFATMQALDINAAEYIKLYFTDESILTKEGAMRPASEVKKWLNERSYSLDDDVNERIFGTGKGRAILTELTQTIHLDDLKELHAEFIDMAVIANTVLQELQPNQSKSVVGGSEGITNYINTVLNYGLE